MIYFILVAILFQLVFLYKNCSRFFIDKRRRKIFKQISKFHEENYTQLAAQTGDFNAMSKMLRMYVNTSETYFKGASLAELKESFLELKVSYSKYLPKVKDENRMENIDKLLAE